MSAIRSSGCSKIQKPENFYEYFPIRQATLTYIQALSPSWKFKVDPTNIGISAEWFASGFDDRAWTPLVSGKSWEIQGFVYSGYAWYRQAVTLPASIAGQAIKITLPAIYSDDDFYFNGIRIGGLKGEYKYNNRKPRHYTVPASSVNTGSSPNQIAIRIWGGAISGQGRNSGLIAGAYRITADPFFMAAKPAGGPESAELPIETFDLSAAQQGMVWDLVVKIDPANIPPVPASGMVYSIADFYRATLGSGSVPVTAGADGISRAIVPVAGSLSTAMYLAGRFTLNYQIVQSGTSSAYTDTGLTIVSAMAAVSEKVWSISLPAGRVDLQPLNVGPIVGMFTIVIPDPAVVVTNLAVNDTANAAHWSLQSNLQVGNPLYGDRAYPISSLGSGLAGAQWIQTANNSRSYAGNPIASFRIDRPATIYICIDRRAASLPWMHTITADHLRFAARDTVSLPSLPAQTDSTPYGNLALNDVVDCSLGPGADAHGYMEAIFGQHAQDYCTPGSQANKPSSVSAILGKNAREPSWGWFAYKVGRNLTPGKTYLLRIEYCEDVPRFGAIEIQAGQNYNDAGWKNGTGPDNPYDPWPLSNAWQFFDVIVPLGTETTGAGGTGDASAANGVWVYFFDKRKPKQYWSIYAGGPVVASIRLYEIDPSVDAPVITKPSGLPTRTMTFDWERQPTGTPADVVNYAKLMGYSAVSPIAGMKWHFQSWADPLAGYDAANTDDQHYWSNNPYVAGSGAAPAPPIAGKPSTHVAYLAATAAAGIDYIPRFEYGGSRDLPLAAQSIGADGKLAKPNRYATYGANLVHPETFAEMKTFLDNFIGQYAATNPQLKGAMWRIRSDRMQISYGHDDAVQYSTDTGTALPAGLATMTAAQIAAWCVVQKPAYDVWWHGKRRDFHQRLASLLQGYRSDLSLYYFNWDVDKFSIGLHDLNSAFFYGQVVTLGGPTAYANDRAARAAFTAADYTTAISNGVFNTAVSTVRPDNPWPDYGLRPSLYGSVSGVMLLAPVNYGCYALPDYINYFQTHDGLALSHCVAFDEIAAREPNPKYEGNMMVPGGAPFSMALELLGYFHGDARVLTYTAYTYGRGFADAHRRFAQAFQALPAVPGALVAGTDPDVAARVYPGLKGSFYIGVAYKGMTAKSISVSISGAWSPGSRIVDLVTGAKAPAAVSGGGLLLDIYAQPMALYAYRVDVAAGPVRRLP
jgi:hypothetical protein